MSVNPTAVTGIRESISAWLAPVVTGAKNAWNKVAQVAASRFAQLSAIVKQGAAQGYRFCAQHPVACGVGVAVVVAAVAYNHFNNAHQSSVGSGE